MILTLISESFKYIINKKINGVLTLLLRRVLKYLRFDNMRWIKDVF